MPSPRIAIFPGSFDPLTNGHLDLIIRGTRLVDKLIVAILENTQKHPMFALSERLDMIRASISNQAPNVEVDAFSGLLVDYVAKRGADIILRGVRGNADYQSELNLAMINRLLRPDTETVFLLASQAYAFVSSSMVKEITLLGGDASPFVPPPVAQMLRAKLGKIDRSS